MTGNIAQNTAKEIAAIKTISFAVMKKDPRFNEALDKFTKEIDNLSLEKYTEELTKLFALYHTNQAREAIGLRINKMMTYTPEKRKILWAAMTDFVTTSKESVRYIIEKNKKTI